HTRVASNVVLGRGAGDLCAILIKDQAACLADRTVRPEHQRDDPAFETLFTQTLPKIISQAANCLTRLVSISRVMETHARVLAEWRCVRHDQAAIIAIAERV